MKKEIKNIVNNKVILNLIQDLQRLLLLFINGMRGRSQIKFGMTSLYNNGGFTLIELLVVVLIIGILAAVALPQYKVTVGKSRYATLKNLAKSIAQAEEVYYLANGTYTTDFEKLAVQMPGGKLDTSTESAYYYDWGKCWLTNNDLSRVDCNSAPLNMSYRIMLQHSPNSSNRINCFILGTTDLSDWRNKICQIETGKTGNKDTKFTQIWYEYK